MKLSWLLLIILGFTGSFFLFFLFSGWAVRVLERMHGFSKFGMSFLLRMAQSLHLYRNSKAVLGYTFLISILSQLIAVCFFIVVGYALGEHLSFLAFLFSVSLGYIATVLPISPGGIGVGQLAFYSFFKTYTGQELQVGVIGITANQTIMFSLGLIGALFYLQRGYKHREKLSI